MQILRIIGFLIIIWACVWAAGAILLLVPFVPGWLLAVLKIVIYLFAIIASVCLFTGTPGWLRWGGTPPA